MDRDTLRALQAPLKDSYKTDPDAALITLKATGTLGAVSTSLQIPINEGRVHAEGDLDFRGTLAVEREAPVGFSDIRLSFELDTAADDEQLATLLKLTERYCVVLQTLSRGPRLDVTLGRAAATAP